MDIKNAKNDINNATSKITQSSVDECLKDRPMRAIERGLQDVDKNVKACIENLEEVTTSVPENSSEEPTTVEPTTVEPGTDE